ncbi:major outer membrane protein [Aliarcobacter cryaerophilus]|uniref:major outer membrane protein n=1 Tax=Aliarcobacter cryaerophilus TaxID=28198 RepID=UPI0021B6D8D9|nr:major outer membrane protein [Aliarcobacter cryaerophilus]MCT7516211.1 major outer membrane protein [Aliarcobacter cryaerophilus]
MRKISKISLVAAVAVAGFSTANAQPLEEAIKNVDVSGSVVYRYDNFDNSEATTNQSNTDVNRYKIGLNLSSKVNDYVKFNSRFIVGGEDAGFVSLDAQTGHRTNNSLDGDNNANVTLSHAYFGFTAIPNTVVNVGKQGLATPYTVAIDINGNEQSGTGILALSTMGPVTAGAGYFNNSNLDKSGDVRVFDAGSDIYVATLQGDLDFVKLEAWYLGVQDSLNSYTLAATSNIDLAENAKLGLEARYVNLKVDSDLVNAPSDQRKNDMFRLAVDGKFSIVNARLAYTKTGKDGGVTATDNDAKNASLGWALTSLAKQDADYWQAALGADILDNLNFTLHYGNLKAKADAPFGVANVSDLKQSEVYGQLTYKMSKNLTTYLRYGNMKSEGYNSGVETHDQNMGRLQVAYTF